MGSYKEGNYAAGAHDQCKDLYTTTQKEMNYVHAYGAVKLGLFGNKQKFVLYV